MRTPVNLRQVSDIDSLKNEKKVNDLLSCRRLVLQLDRLTKSFNTLLISCEKGLGTSSIMLQYLHHLKKNEEKWCYIDASLHSVEELSSRLDALNNLDIEDNDEYIVVLDNVYELNRDVINEVTSLSQAGVRMIICALPEYVECLRELDKCVPIFATDLLLELDECEYWGLSKRVVRSFNFKNNCRCIPSLVAQWDPDDLLYQDNRLPFSKYELQLKDIATHYLRDSLDRASLQMRLAMMVLGSGKIDVLKDIVDEFDWEDVKEIKRDCLLFDIDFNRMTFDFVAKDNSDVYSALYEKHYRYILEHKELVDRCIEHLVEKKDFRRVGFVTSELFEKEELCEVATRWPFDLINHGYSELVIDAGEEIKNYSDEKYRYLKLCYCLATGDVFSASDYLKDSHKTNEREDVLSILFYELTYLRKNANHELKDLSSVVDSIDDELTADLYLHYLAMRSMVDGFATKAYSLLLLHVNEDPKDLISSLLYLDLMIASLLVGDFGVLDNKECIKLAKKFVSKCEIDGLRIYMLAVANSIESLINNNFDIKYIERCSGSSNKRHDYTVSTIVMLTMAIYDVTQENYVRGLTRVRISKIDAQRARYNFGLVVNAVCLGLVSAGLGEEFNLDTYDIKANKTPETLCLVIALLLLNQKSQAEELAKTLTGKRPTTCIFWLVKASILKKGSIKESLSRILPASWVKAYASFIAIDTKNTQALKAVEVFEEKEQEDMMRINLLGEFKVYVGKTEITERDWRRSASRNLLMLLAVADNHTMTRAKAMSILWPGKDYVSGKGNLYTVLSTLKSTLGGTDEMPYVYSTQGFISLDNDCVEVDIDEFEALAKSIITTPAYDEDILSKCELLHKLYKGSLFMPLEDNSGIFYGAQKRIDKLCADAMVIGAEVALDQDLPKQAVWYARTSLEADPMREDAVVALMQALAKTGRQVEIHEVYSEFTSRVIMESGVPPTKNLRELFRRLTDKSCAKTSLSQIAYDTINGDILG